MRSSQSIANGRRLSREAKRRRHGTCERCGAPTRYGGQQGRPAVSRFCVPCGSEFAAELTHARIGSGPSQQRLLALLRTRGEMRIVEIRDEMGWGTTSATSARLNRQLRYGLIERVRRGVYRATDRAST